MLERSLPNFAELEALLSQPPVLRTEDAKLYDEIRARFMACFRPEDVIQWWLVDRLVDNAWLIRRYSRHQTVAVERWFQQSLQFQAQRVKLQNATKEKRTSFLADRMSQTPPDVAQLGHLEDTIMESLSDVEEILERTPTELEHNRVLEKSITFQEQLDKLIANATKRFNEAFVLLEHYNEVVGGRVRQAAQELFAPNCGQPDKNHCLQTEAPSIVSTDQTPSEKVDQTRDAEADQDPSPVAIDQTPSADADRPSPPIETEQVLNPEADRASPDADQIVGAEVGQVPPSMNAPPSAAPDQTPDQ
jgi:hypothetical protein